MIRAAFARVHASPAARAARPAIAGKMFGRTSDEAAPSATVMCLKTARTSREPIALPRSQTVGRIFAKSAGNAVPYAAVTLSSIA
jgi:hypothetical protein